MQDPTLGDPSTPVGLRKHLERRFNGMRAARGNWEPTWYEIARFSSPRISRYLAAYAGQSGGSTNGEVQVSNRDQVNTKLLDSRAVWASEVLANGMHSGLTHPSRPWFKASSGDSDLDKFQSVREWLDEVERRLYDYFARTNFYTAIKGGYRQLGNYGINAGFMEGHWQYGGVTHPMTVGEYWVAQGPGLTNDTLYRRVDMTVIQICKRFGKGLSLNELTSRLPRRVMEDYNQARYENRYTVYHAVEPNDLRDPTKYDSRNMAYRSVYWMSCDEAEKADPKKALLEEKGFRSQPFWAPRWDMESTSDTYGSTSPGLSALADARQIQFGVLRKQQSIDYVMTPPLRGPATLMNMHVSLQPKRVTAMAGMDKDSFGALWTVPPQLVNVISQDNAEIREAIDRGYYADLFNAITNMQGVQPRNVEEIAARNEEKLTQLGPVVERVNQEMLAVAIDRAFDILDQMGAIPPAPEELQGQALKIEFISVLAQAQRLIGLGGIERTFGFASSIAAAFPDALDALNPDAAMDEYGDITGIAAKIMRSPEEREQMRAQRAQQQAAAQAAENAATLAPAAKAGAETAQLLFDSPGVGSVPTLADRLLGTV